MKDMTTPQDLAADLLFLFIAILHNDEDSIEDARQWFLENIQSVESFSEAGVMITNPGIKFDLKDGSRLHAEITH